MFQIRTTDQQDEDDLRRVHEAAFGSDEGPTIAGLTVELLHDPTAEPVMSLLACEGADAVGHVLFTRVRIAEPEASLTAHILAPLAVMPDCQGKGVGARLVRDGLSRLTDSGSELVFVLGYPDYYTRFGFRPAGAVDLAAPYPIPEKNADAWMVLELRHGVIGRVSGVVKCAKALDKPEYWVE